MGHKENGYSKRWSNIFAQLVIREDFLLLKTCETIFTLNFRLSNKIHRYMHIINNKNNNKIWNGYINENEG